ncbi:restriction endonuclease subunit S [Stutzerimonas nitrititolerans]|uniref:restriction endonuclease subunit S n=1 Tax=Stutzerimonas nitrititolerans TaxID=2482751 RepID=UPI00289A9B59|nr:restriction endonuclease subunit S [Stutzerimonas nitrititolerans]
MSWKHVALADVSDVFNGKTPSKDDQRDAGHPVLKIKDVGENRSFKGPFESFVDPELADKFSGKHLELDDSLILNAAHNSDYVGSKQYRAEQAVVGALPTGEWLIARASTGKLHPRFLNYWLQSPQARFQIRQLVKGIHLYPKDVMRLEIPLPPLPEQKRIAAILDKADAIRRKRQQAIQLADDFLRAVFLDMFGDPVTNPKGWDVKPLSAGIRSISSGWSASGENRPCSDGEKGVLKISAVTSGVFKPEENKTVPLDQIPEGKKLLFPKRGDLLFSRANTRELVAASCIVMTDVEDVFLPDKLWLVETDKKKLLPEFLNYLLWQPRFKERLTSQATGTSGSMLNISKSKFEETDAFFPSMELQGKFKRIYWALQETLDASASSREAGDSLFESLSQKAFSGQL